MGMGFHQTTKAWPRLATLVGPKFYPHRVRIQRVSAIRIRVSNSDFCSVLQYSLCSDPDLEQWWPWPFVKKIIGANTGYVFLSSYYISYLIDFRSTTTSSPAVCPQQWGSWSFVYIIIGCNMVNTGYVLLSIYHVSVYNLFQDYHNISSWPSPRARRKRRAIPRDLR